MFKLDANLIEWNLKSAQKYNDPVKNVIQKGLQSSCTIFVSTPDKQWSGSGFHVGNGLIVTAGHVVPEDMGQYKIEVSFDSQNIYPAEFVTTNSEVDAGVISCTPISNLIPALQLADSDRLEVGDMVAVIGAPEGFHDTATVGRISNIHQSLNDETIGPAWNDVLFFDADILEGSSGGMILTMDGLVAGSVMGVTGQHAEIGIGENAACPSNKIKAMLVQL